MNTQRVEGHTPLPWLHGGWDGHCNKKHIHRGERGEDPCVYDQEFSEGGARISAGTQENRISVIDLDNYDGYILTEEDAAFIVHACNNIERLEKVNEALVRALENCVANMRGIMNETDIASVVICNQAEATLKLAKEPA